MQSLENCLQMRWKKIACSKFAFSAPLGKQFGQIITTFLIQYLCFVNVNLLCYAQNFSDHVI